MTEEEGASYSRSNVAEAVLDYIASRGSASTAEVADAAGVSRKTAARYIRDLLEQGLIEGIGSLNSPKRRYRLTSSR